MKTKRGKRSEAFWPSIMMKKWLNIKPKGYDFSEDEVDTETENDSDAYSLQDARRHMREDNARSMHGIQSKCPSQTSDTPAKDHKLRHRRGKSETLRAQYINTKDMRVKISTWNVAGRIPNEDLEIDDWLCTEEPADIYILGFQEVVPLNAGNVLGSEDNTPIHKWEAIIRRTLNKSWEPESKHKSCSAPVSPVLRTCAADILADDVDANPLGIMTEEYFGTVDDCKLEQQELDKVIGLGKNLQLRSIYGIGFDSRFDWPEHSLDATPHIGAANSKFRRVWRSSGRIGFEDPMASDRKDFALKGGGLKCSHYTSGNLGLFCKDHQSGILMGSKKSCTLFVRVVSKQMVGVYVSVWVRRRLRRHVNNLQVSPVGVGFMGYMGNKGSVSVSMSLFQSRLCFVCSHLTSGQKDGAEQRRNYDVNEILRRTHFSSVFDTDQPQTIPCHDQIFWFGDLNYRLNMLDAEVRKLVALRKWGELMNSDQLREELRSGHVFDGWKEGLIDFPPTYKYEINSNRYAGEIPKEREKKRSPAWCDRILWLGKGIKQLSYRRTKINLSDHHPVSSLFLVEVEVFDNRKLQRALKFTEAAVHPEVLLGEDGEL
ncbi:putative Type I inositol polyphosphate 5-phosphatase [Quillaja saponaria]|uniref:Type I inositol polyphosphate 5-phosphatase n=1 Tax=Quillaja saponaria TaxID=32244 RepID=A0AAD7KRR8_QUISA|nr:putative Type I inositol polyphosphate 5-phosphatase [Quillaja saponaria]